MGILYLISIVILFASFMIVKKSKKEINILNFIFISIVILLCYNAFICYILTFFTIPIKLWILAIINIIISLMFITIIYFKKEIQKYYFKRIDLFFIFIIGLVVLIISYKYFKFPFNINFESTDAAVHYMAATMFAKSDGLLANKTQSDVFFNTLSTMRIGSYVNVGILIKCFSDASNFVINYKIFIAFEIFVLFLIGAIVYLSLSNFAKKNIQLVWCLLISTICLLGYPLNSMLFGFSYLTVGLLIVTTIINIIFYYCKNIIKLRYVIAMLFLLNFGLFSSYYMFVTFVYPALWIYFCIENYNRTNRIVTKKLCIILITTLLIPFILGFIYYMTPEIYSILINKNLNLCKVMRTSDLLINSGLSTPGYTYINLYSNMLLLIPSIIYLFFKDRNNNKFILLLSCCNILIIIILLIGNKLDKVSSYYLSKNYYTLWIILLYALGKSLILLSEKDMYLPRLLLYTYIFLIIISVLMSNLQIRYVLRNEKEKLTSVMEIFQANKSILINKPIELNQEELEILKYVKNNINPSNDIDVVADEGTYCWTHSLVNCISNENEYKEFVQGEKALATKCFYIDQKIDKVDYMIYFKKSKKYNRIKDKLFEDSEIIFENSAGGILKYKN